MADEALDLLPAGDLALTAGDWPSARAAFESALTEDDTPEARDGLSRALWWLEGSAAAITEREKAYAGYRRTGNERAAAHAAVWISHEYDRGVRNPAAADGWFSRAENLLDELPEGPDHARLQLAQAERSSDPLEARKHAKEALDIARRQNDIDLEVMALGRLGLAEVVVGAVESGTSRLDEAMAAALGGETQDLETLGELCCTLISACDQTGDVERLHQWNRLLGAATHQRHELPVLSFCGCCSAETLIAGGHIEAAERELSRALQIVEETGSAGRCVDPRSRLADLLVRQGRFEEAEQLLPGAGGDGWTVRALAELHLARGEPGAAVIALERRLRQIGDDSLLAVTVLDLLVQARIADEDLGGAEQALDSLAGLAESSGLTRVRAYAARARGRVLATRDVGASWEHYERAIELFSREGMDLEVGRSQYDLALSLQATDRHAAVAQGRNARSALHASRATFERDKASALLRELGDESRPPSREPVDDLTAREVEVLQLVGEGLTNNEIAARLFISPKTAGHHVSNILLKLGVRNRSQAAAAATRARAIPDDVGQGTE